MPKSSFVLQYFMNKTKNGKRTSNNQLCFTIIIMSYFWSELKKFMGYGEGAKNPAFHEQDTDH